MKKINLVLFVLALALFTVTSCSRDDDDQNNNNNNTNNPLSQALGGSPTIPSDAAGALYAVNNYVIADDGFGEMDTTEMGTAYAWFESYATTTNAGTVSCNTSELENSFSGVALPWYYTISYVVDYITGGNAVDWSVSGNTSTGIAGFNHTDNTAFPKCNFSVPSTVSRNSSLTITCTNQTSNDAVFFTIYGQGNAKVTKAQPANATSATFTAAEVQSVAASGALIGIQVMPVTLNPATYNGKKYYFVKQWAFAQFSTAI